MNKQRVIIVLILVVIAVALAVWSIRNRTASVDSALTDSRVRVVTSFYPLYYFAEQIAGDKANIINITPAGGEPHDYEPTPQDIIQIAESRLLVMNGGGLETWGDKVKQIINPSHTLVVVAGDGIFGQSRDDAGNIVLGPHVWLSPLLAQRMVEKIKAAFLQIDPINSEYYISRTLALEAKLHDLDLA